MTRQITDLIPLIGNDGQIYYAQLNGLGDAAKTSGILTSTGGIIAAAGAVTTGTIVGAPAGVVLAAVGGIVAGAGALIGAIGGNSKAKQLAAERGQYDTANAQLRQENAQLEAKINELQNGLNKIKSQLGLNGLGLCIIGCKKKREETKLNNAKDEYNRLVAEQQQKTSLLQNLIKQYDKIKTQYEKATSTAKTNNMLLWGLGGAIAIVAGILIFKNQ